MANTRETPDETSIIAFIQALQEHDKVASEIRRPSAYVVEIELKNGTSMAVFLTNIYVVGVADVQEIRHQHPEIHSIVTLSSWNMASGEAVEYGQKNEIGVFKWKDFFGAINYKKYWLYEQLPMGINATQANIERRRRQNEWN